MTTETTPAPKKKRTWLKVVLAIVLLIVLLVALTPTLLSTGPGTNFVVGQINNRIAGRVAIDDLSLGWFSGMKASGVTISDPGGQQVTRIDTLDTGLTLLGLLTSSDINAGNVTARVAETTLISDASGQTNLQRALAPKATPVATPQPQPTPAAPSPQPASSGKIIKANLSLLTGKTTWQSPNQPLLTIDTLTAKANIDTAGGPLTFSANTSVRSGDGKPAAISANGDMQVFTHGTLRDPEQMTGTGDATITALDLAAITPLLKSLGLDLQLAGTLNSKMLFKAANGAVELTGDNTVAQFAATGGMLKGDTLRSATIRLPINMKSQGDLLTFSNTQFASDFANVTITGDTTMASLRALNGETVTNLRDAKLTLAGKADIKALAMQLPKTLALREGTTLDRGVATLDGHITTSNAKVQAALAATLNDVEGTQAGRRIALEPLTVVASATPANNKLTLNANIKMPPTGETINITATPQPDDAIKLAGTYNLDRLTNQLGQFIDLADKRFTGLGTIDGTVSYSSNIARANVTVGIQRFQAIMPNAPQQIAPTNLAVVFAADIDTAKQLITITQDTSIEERDPASGAGNKIHLPKGTTYAYGKTGDINVRATVDYDLARINALAGPFLPEGLQMAGKKSMPISLTGKLADGEGFKKFRNLQLAPTTFSYDRIRVKGVDLAAGEIPLKLENGIMPIGPSKLSANGGAFNLVGRVDLTQDLPAFILEKSNVPYELVSNLGINQEVAAGPLRFLPLTWGATGKDLNLVNVTGLVTFEVTDAYLPLDYATLQKKGTLNARINIDKLRTDAPIFSQLSGVIGSLFNFGSKGMPVIEGDIRNITLVLKDGRVFYDNFVLGADFGRMNFSGSVGLDQTLAMNVEVGTKSLNVPIPVGLGGTTAKPVATVSDRFTKDIGALLLKGASDPNSLKDAEKDLKDLGKGLGDLFKKPKKDGNAKEK